MVVAKGEEENGIRHRSPLAGGNESGQRRLGRFLGDAGPPCEIVNMRTTAPGHEALGEGAIEILWRRSDDEVGRTIEVKLPVEAALLRQTRDPPLQQQETQG